MSDGAQDVALVREKSRAERRKDNWRRIVVSVLTVLTLVTVGGGVWWGTTWMFGSCFGMSKSDGGTCYGITDGSTIVHGELEDVGNKIEAENDRAADQSVPPITVALLTPVPVRGGEPDLASLDQVRAQLEGAHTAQLKANQVLPSPKVRLVIAAEGPNAEHWDQVTNKLVAMKDTEHIVAVTGLGVSSAQTKQAAVKLGNAGLPMVGSVLTADDLNAKDVVDGLFRVSPGNGREVSALASARQQLPGPQLLIVETYEEDFYASGLRTEFEKKFPGLRRMSIDGRSQETIPSQFAEVREQMCQPGGPRTVLYAGRANVFKELMTSLGERACHDPVTVVTGSDGAIAQEIPRPRGRASVVYASLATPEVLDRREMNPAHQNYLDFKSKFESAGFDLRDLDNGWAIMNYDAMTAVRTAIEASSRESSTVDANSVNVMLKRSNEGLVRVQGTAGDFTFDEQGRPKGQRIDIMRLGPDGDKPEIVKPDSGEHSGQ